MHSAIMNLYIETINMIPDWNLCYNFFGFGMAEHYSVLCDICLIGKLESSIGFIFFETIMKTPTTKTINFGSYRKEKFHLWLLVHFASEINDTLSYYMQRSTVEWLQTSNKFGNKFILLYWCMDAQLT